MCQPFTLVYARITNEKIKADMLRLAATLPELGKMTPEEIEASVKKNNPVSPHKDII